MSTVASGHWLCCQCSWNQCYSLLMRSSYHLMGVLSRLSLFYNHGEMIVHDLIIGNLI